jgi:ABC-type transport system substrate-binding protein
MELLALVPATNSPALQDGRMRQAVAAAIDRSTLLNVIFQKQGEAASAILPNWMTGYDFMFPAAQNLALARDLRGQSKQASTITIAYEPADATQQLVADRVALNARDAGIAMQSAARGKTQTDFDLLRISLSSPNPSIALHQITAWFLPGDTETVSDDLTTLFKDESELLSSGKVIPLLYVPKGIAASQRVHNWSVDWDGTPAIAQFWVEDRR